MFFNLIESLVRIILFVSGLFFVVPVLSSIIPTSSYVEIQILEVILGIINILFLVFFLCNLVVTSYTPFGRSVSSGDSFLTTFTGYNTRIVVSVLGLSLVYTNNADQSYSLSVSQNSVLNKTAYILGEGEFFTDITLEDSIGETLRDNLFYAQNALLFGGVAFVFLWLFEFYIIGMFYNTQIGGSQWYVVRWYQKNPELLGLPARGPAVRNLVIALFAAAAGVFEVFHITQTSATLTYKDFFPCFVFIINCLLVVIGSLLRFMQNFVRRRLSPVLAIDIIGLLQLWVHSSLYTLPLVYPTVNLRFVGYLFPAGFIVLNVITFNINLIKIIPLSLRDNVDFVIVNLARDNVNKFFRFVWSISLVLGIVALFFAYYAYLGDAFDFSFSSGTFVTDITDITDDIEEKFDLIIDDVNDFMVSVTPCTTTDTVYLSNPDLISVRDANGVVTTYDAPTPAEMITQLKDNDYFDVCFSGSAWDTPFSDSRCDDPYAAYLESESNQTAFATGTLPGTNQVDASFTDDENKPVSFQVLTVDSQCFTILCDAFTVLTGGLFAATLIPFVNIGAAVASKAARIAWKISRLGQRLLKYARKMYAKRRKLSRYVKLLKQLQAIGNPALKFNIAVAFMFIPTVVIGLFCILLAFFKRDISDKGRRTFLQQESARVQLLIIFLGLSLFNLALFIGFFGFGVSGSRSLDLVDSMMNSLPANLIVVEVEYGLGMRYLRYTLIVSFVSGLFFSAALAIETIYALLKNPFKKRKSYAKIEDVETVRGGFAEAPAGIQLELKNNILALFTACLFLIPVIYLTTECVNNDQCRWFKLQAEQGDKLADIAEAVANSEIILESSEVVNTEIGSEERSCGIISLAVEPIFDALLDALADSFGPLGASLLLLKTESAKLLGAVKIDNIFAAIDINFEWSQAEFFIIFALPLAYIVIIVLDIILTTIYMFTKNTSLLPVVNNIETMLFGIALVAVQVNLVIFGVFASFGELDVPLFNLKIMMGKLIEYGLYSSILCVTASVSLYFNRLIPLI